MKLPELTSSNNRVVHTAICRDYMYGNTTQEEIASKYGVTSSTVERIVYKNRKDLQPDPEFFRIRRIRIINSLCQKLAGKVNKNRDIFDVVQLMNKEFPDFNISSIASGLPNFTVNIALGGMSTLGKNLNYIDPDKVVEVVSSPVQSNQTAMVSIPIQSETGMVSSPVLTTSESSGMVSQSIPVEKVDVALPPSNCVENVQLPQIVSKKRPAGRMSEIQRNRLAERISALREGRAPAIQRKAKNLGAAKNSTLGQFGT